VERAAGETTVRLILVPAFFLFVSSFAAHAADPDNDRIIVTADRSPERVDDSLSSVSVVTQADIERVQARNLQDVLTSIPGVELANTGGPGKTTSLFLRGTNSDHVLVLIDGVKVGSATSGTTAFEQLPVDQIERIEVVRGPRSSLYGSEAIGGVVQIFTRHARGEDPFALSSVSTSAGSEGTIKYQAGVNGSTDRLWYNVSGSGYETDGIDARPSLHQPDRDGFRSTSGSLRAGARFGKDGEVSVGWLQVHDRNEFDGTTQDEAHNNQQVLSASVAMSPVERWRTSLVLGHSEDRNDNFFHHIFNSRFNTSRDTASWQNDVRFTDTQSVTLGGDYQNDRIDSTTRYGVDSRDDVAAFGEYRAKFGSQDVELSAREDHDEQFGSHETYGAAWGYTFANQVKLTASYGTAFKAPTFNQLYFPGFGNPNLSPEKSHSTELGLSRYASAWDWTVSAYETNVTGLIANANTPVGLLPVNIGRARIRGVEAQLALHLGDWRVQGYAAYLEPKDESSTANNGNLLPRRTKSNGHVEVDRQFGPLALGLTYEAFGSRFDDARNTIRLDGYQTLDVRAEYQVAPHWRIQGIAANALDKRYSTVATYAQPRRTYFVTVRYSPSAS
jgi:vitamin B12 transporter